MFRFSQCRTAVILLVAFLFAGCAATPPMKPFYNRFSVFGIFGGRPQGPAPLQPPPVERGDFWEDQPAARSPTIVVNLTHQRAYFYRGTKVVGATKVSTGKKGFATPPGSYSVIQRNKDHVSSLYGDYVDGEGTVMQANVDTSKSSPPEGAKFRGAKMPYFLRFYGGYGLHAGRVPNYPASHGCVRLPSKMAKHFFENAAYGTPVIVER